MRDKQLSIEDAPGVLAKARAEGKKIVQCHGTFDLVHPGHVVHFEEAKALGDLLVVTITAEEFVNKGPGRPYFSDQLRVKSLAALEAVDYVVVVPYPAAVEAIECVHPDVYCKGREYENPDIDVTGNIHDDISTVERLGGEIAYVGSVTFSSTRLLNQSFDTYGDDVKAFCSRLASKCSSDDFRKVVDSLSDVRVLVIGDVIFDRYSTVTVQGLTSKNRIMSGRFHGDDLQAGGSLAVFRHVRQFAPRVKLVGLVGAEPWVEEELSRYVSVDEDEILRAPEFTTVVKQRFVEPLSEGKELTKLFAVNYIDAQHPAGDVADAVQGRVASLIDGSDLVLAMDFGHGTMDAGVRDLVQDKARFLALNCQTNSNNHGFNVINRQYRRADSFSLDQTEMCLACGLRRPNFQQELGQLQRQMDAKYAWLTRGAVETIGLKQGEEPCSCPPFERVVVDTVGAGDAFCAVSSLAAARDLPIGLATFMGQLAGAQAVRITGNREPVDKPRLVKGGQAMLNF